MSTITAILEADADGTLHLPLPVELRSGKIRVEARLVPVEAEPPGEAREQRKKALLEIMRRLRARNPFKDVADPVAWQRVMREDVALPGRD